MKSNRTVSLDWARLLGFEQVDRASAARNARIGDKVGDKGGPIFPPAEGISARIGNKVGDKGGPIRPPIDGIGRD